MNRSFLEKNEPKKLKSLWQELQEQLNAAFRNSIESRKSPEAGFKKMNYELENLTFLLMLLYFC